MSKHTITAEVEVKFRFPGLADGEHETAYPKLEIEYTFSPGYPGCGPSLSDPGSPPEPAEVDLISAKLLDGDGLTPTQKEIDDWASEWLWGDGYDRACDHAEDCRRPDPDEAYERMRDDGQQYLTGNEDDF